MNRIRYRSKEGSRAIGRKNSESYQMKFKQRDRTRNMSRNLTKNMSRNLSILNEISKAGLMEETGDPNFDEKSLDLGHAHELQRIRKMSNPRIPRKLIRIMENGGFPVLNNSRASSQSNNNSSMNVKLKKSKSLSQIKG